MIRQQNFAVFSCQIKRSVQKTSAEKQRIIVILVGKSKLQEMGLTKQQIRKESGLYPFILCLIFKQC